MNEGAAKTFKAGTRKLKLDQRLWGKPFPLDSAHPAGDLTKLFRSL